MTNMDDKIFNQYIKERDEAALSLDLRKFKTFVKKWHSTGLFSFSSPEILNDMVLMIAMHQMVLGIAGAPESKIIEAQLWLIDHGCDPHPWRRLSDGK